MKGINTVTISIRTDPKTKKEAEKIANNLGFKLSTLLNAYLKKLVRTKEIRFSDEEAGLDIYDALQDEGSRPAKSINLDKSPNK